MHAIRDFIYTIPESILFDDRITDLDRKIYMIIRSFMDTTGSCYASNNWVASKLKIDRRSVIRCIDRLENAGYIIRSIENEQRYLKIKYTKCIEEVVTLQSPPSDSTVTPPSDSTVTQLVSNIIITKNNKDITPQPSADAPMALDINYEYPETLYPKTLNPVVRETGNDIASLSTTRTEIKNKKSKLNKEDLLTENPHNIPEDYIDEWMDARKSKRAPITKRVWLHLNCELSKCTNPIRSFEEMLIRGWSTLKHEWINNENKKDDNPLDFTSTKWINNITDRIRGIS